MKTQILSLIMVSLATATSSAMTYYCYDGSTKKAEIDCPAKIQPGEFYYCGQLQAAGNGYVLKNKTQWPNTEFKEYLFVDPINEQTEELLNESVDALKQRPESTICIVSATQESDSIIKARLAYRAQ